MSEAGSRTNASRLTTSSSATPKSFSKTKTRDGKSALSVVTDGITTGDESDALVTQMQPSPWLSVQMGADAVFPYIVSIFRSEKFNNTAYPTTHVWMKDSPFDCMDPNDSTGDPMEAYAACEAQAQQRTVIPGNVSSKLFTWLPSAE